MNLQRSSHVHRHVSIARFALVAPAVLALATSPIGAQTASPNAGQPSALWRAGVGVALATAIAQASDTPNAWPQTLEGASWRLGDQAGFTIVRAASQTALDGAFGLTRATSPCPSAAWARTRCAVSQTFLARTRDGAARPDVARIGGLALAATGSLLWRPERATRAGAGTFVLSRVGSGLLVAAVRHGLNTRKTSSPD
jgi:hypothetical protein